MSLSSVAVVGFDKGETTLQTQSNNDFKKAAKQLEELIIISFEKKWNIHSALGGKYGELVVASELLKHEPKIGENRKCVKDIIRPTSADIVLLKTKKKIKIEVKWGMLHHLEGDQYFDTHGKIPYWGWGFGPQGSQFKKDKFDYCVLLAATQNGAKPRHIFILTSQEMKKSMERRKSERGKKGSYFVQTPEDNTPKKLTKISLGRPLEIEKTLLDRMKHRRRWKELKQSGCL